MTATWPTTTPLGDTDLEMTIGSKVDPVLSAASVELTDTDIDEIEGEPR
jgi:hypothetical protein